MSKFFSIFLFLSLSAQSQTTGEKLKQVNLARLESFRSECLLKFSGNQRLCRKRVLKQCRDMLDKKECISLMSQMPESKIPKTNGPGQLQ